MNMCVAAEGGEALPWPRSPPGHTSGAVIASTTTGTQRNGYPHAAGIPRACAHERPLGPRICLQRHQPETPTAQKFARPSSSAPPPPLPQGMLVGRGSHYGRASTD